MPEIKAERKQEARDSQEFEDVVDAEEYEEARSKIWLGRKQFNGHDPDDPRDPERDPIEAGS